MLPQVGISGGTPRPRKLSAASEMIAEAMENVPITTADGNRFGKIWRRMMRVCLAPSDRAASTNSRVRSESACPRDDPAVGDPALADQRKDQVFEPLAEERHDGDRQQQRRERPHHLDELLNQQNRSSRRSSRRSRRAPVPTTPEMITTMTAITSEMRAP